MQQLQQKSETTEKQDQIKSLRFQIEQILQTNHRASVDSELALVLAQDYPLESWLPNPFFLGFRDKELLLRRNDVLIVSRLDACRAI